MRILFILEDYVYVFIFFLIACLIPFGALSLSSLVRPKGVGPERRTTYESGIEPMGEARIQFLYPWAVTFNQLGLSAFIEAFIFISILVLGLVYAWRKGALEWS